MFRSTFVVTALAAVFATIVLFSAVIRATADAAGLSWLPVLS